jgi:hypothetical protein
LSIQKVEKLKTDIHLLKQGRGDFSRPSESWTTGQWGLEVK